MYQPWHVLHDLGDWVVRWAPLPARRRAELSWATKTITMRPGMLQAERRSVLAHELEHIERGPFPRWMTAREETAVNAAAARKLIGITELGEALAWAGSMAEAADELWVDVPTLQARLDHLHPSERHYLRRRLETASHGPNRCDGRRAALSGDARQLQVCAGCRYLDECHQS